MTLRSDDADPDASTGDPTGAGLRLALWGGAVLALVAGGLVLWSARASAVFVDMLSAAIAWCF
jgi:cytochrome c-type biogenesis protein CcmH/NrfF